MTKDNFDAFVKSDVVNFMVAHSLQKITIEDGTGRKGVVKVNKDGEYVVQVTSKEVL
jgi:hypothetical protein